MRRVAVLAIVSVLLVAGLVAFTLSPTPEEPTVLDAVTVTDGDQPALAVSEPVETSDPVSRVVAEGDGRVVASGDHVRVDLLMANGQDGALLESTFTQPSSIVFEIPAADSTSLAATSPPLPPGMAEALEGVATGSTVLVALRADDFYGEYASQVGLQAEQTLLVYVEVLGSTDVGDAEAPSGDAVELPAGVPVPVEDGEDVTGLDGSAAAPTPEAAAHVAIQGEGREVQPGQAIVADYVGQVHPSGAVFDSSFARESPTVFSLDRVIPCWTDLLVGQQVGSRVVLTCPTETAYGDSPQEGSGIQPGDALAFVVDIRDAF